MCTLTHRALPQCLPTICAKAYFSRKKPWLIFSISLVALHSMNLSLFRSLGRVRACRTLFFSCFVCSYYQFVLYLFILLCVLFFIFVSFVRYLVLFVKLDSVNFY